jgi:hypothetical protein
MVNASVQILINPSVLYLSFEVLVRSDGVSIAKNKVSKSFFFPRIPAHLYLWTGPMRATTTGVCTKYVVAHDSTLQSSPGHCRG